MADDASVHSDGTNDGGFDAGEYDATQNSGVSFASESAKEDANFMDVLGPILPGEAERAGFRVPYIIHGDAMTFGRGSNCTFVLPNDPKKNCFGTTFRRSLPGTRLCHSFSWS